MKLGASWRWVAADTGRQRVAVALLAFVLIMGAGMGAQLAGSGDGALHELLPWSGAGRTGPGGGAEGLGDGTVDQAAGLGTGDGPFGTLQLTATAGRMVVLNGRATVTVDDVEETFARVVTRVQELGGYVAGSSLGEQPGPIQPWLRTDAPSDAAALGRLTVRIPAAEVMDVLDYVCGLGRACTRATDSDDITDRYVDIEARLNTYRAQEARLVELLARAENLDELLQVEAELWRVRQEIERLEAQLRRWDDAVELATVTVTLERREGLGPGQCEFTQRLGDAVRESISLFIGGIETMILGLGVLAPWALLAAAGWLGYRRWRGSRPLSPPA